MNFINVLNNYLQMDNMHSRLSVYITSSNIYVGLLSLCCHNKSCRRYDLHFISLILQQTAKSQNNPWSFVYGTMELKFASSCLFDCLIMMPQMVKCPFQMHSSSSCLTVLLIVRYMVYCYITV